MANVLAWGFSGLWLLLLTRLFNRGSKYDSNHPLRIACAAWALMFLLAASQIIEFPAVSWQPWLYLTAFASLLAIGIALGAGKRPSAAARDKQLPIDFTPSPESLNMVKAVVILGAIGVFISIYIALVEHPIDLTDLDSIRNPQLMNVVGTTTWVDRIGYLTLPFPWMGFVLTSLFSERLAGRFRTFAIASVIGLAMLGVFSAGRSIQLRIMLLFIVSLWVRRSMGLSPWPFKWTLSRRALAALLLVAVGWYFLVFVWSWRAGGLSNLSIDAGRFHKDASESIMLRGLPKGTPEYAKSLVTYSALYTATIPDNFASFYVDVNLDPYYGFWELQPLVLGLTRMGFAIKPIDEILRETTRGFEAVGLRPAQYRSMAQEFILDFGKPGALVMILLNGLMIGYLYRRFRRGKAHFALPLSLFLMWIIFGAWTGPYGYIELLQCGLALVFAAVAEMRVSGKWLPLADRNQHRATVGLRARRV
jgi:hypothetical protein